MTDHSTSPCLSVGTTHTTHEPETGRDGANPVCFICRRPINEPGGAMVMAPRLTDDNELPRDDVWTVHKGVCLDTAEEFFGGAAPAEELITWLRRPAAAR